jgi:autotransporter-associated beta strand protein
VIQIANTAGAVLNLAGFSQTTTGLSGGGVTGGEVKIGGQTFTINVVSLTSNTYSGTLSGTGTFTKGGLGSLTLSGSNTFTGGVNVTGGTLSLGSSLPGAAILNISDQARVAMTSGNKTLGVTSLNLNTTGVLDLNDSAMVIDYTTTSPLTTIANQIKAGSTDKSSIGPGNIISTAAVNVANSPTPFKTALGFGDNSTLGYTSFGGKTVDATATLVRYTFIGDANLDGRVNALDFNAVATNFSASTNLWTRGDFNSDGTVNSLDFSALAVNYNQVLAAAPLSSGLGALVPEPAALAAVAGALLLGRRRRAR